MDKNNQKPFLKKERKQTDDSLTFERGKADKTFEKYRITTESESDSELKRSRSEADEARFQLRDDADAERDPSEEDLAILNERHIEDRTIRNERSIADSVIESERDQKVKITATLLNQERKSTDLNLSFERAQTDMQVASSASILLGEKSAHKETQAALTTRDEFNAIVSHDLRNPIGAILSCSEMLLDDSSVGPISKDVKDWIQFIHRNAKSALGLISDLLDMERMSGGNLQLSLGEHRIADLIKESVQNHSHLASAKSVLLRFARSESDTLVQCDWDRITQVLANLISNAIKFTPEGGTVAMKLEESEKEVTISVCDTGPGIREEMKGRIFERFAQLQNNDRRGLGLGLYISKMLVESHHGRLWVTSTPPDGSIFYVALPKHLATIN